MTGDSGVFLGGSAIAAVGGGGHRAWARERPGRSPDDDPVDIAQLLVERIEDTEQAARQARRLLCDAMWAAHTRARAQRQ